MNPQMEKTSDFINQKTLSRIDGKENETSHSDFLPFGSVSKEKILEMFPILNKTKKISHLMFIDFIHFETIHNQFDEPMKERLFGMIANRLGICVREDDAIRRIGRAEFVLLLKIQKLDELKQIFEQIQDTLRRPVYLGSQSLTIFDSARFSFYPQIN